MSGRVTFSTLGKRGRFGNQLFVFAFAKALEQRGYEVQLPQDWIGRSLFSVTNPAITKTLTPIDLDRCLLDGSFDWWINHLDGADILTYGQSQQYIDYYTREQCKQWFALQPNWQEYERRLIGSLEGGYPCRDYYACCHLRRGDYERPPFNSLYATISDLSYRRAIEKFHVVEPILWITEGWREPSKETVAAGFPFLDDFLILRWASVLLRANSSFSVWAAWLGDGKVFSPVVGDKVGWNDIEFVVGNHPRTAPARNQSDLWLKEK